MPMLPDVQVEALDLGGVALFSVSVPFERGLTAMALLEAAFVRCQLASPPSLFDYTLEYFGYDTAEPKMYLGYEVESVGLRGQTAYANDASHYWELLLDGTASQVGADTLQPAPGSNVTWRYTAFAAPGAQSARASRVRSRHAA